MTARNTVRALLMSSAALLLAGQPQAQEIIDLDAITVDSKREVQSDTARAETVVDLEEIEDRQAGTIAELVDSAPGVNLVNGGSPVGSGINIRGFGANGIYGTDQKVGIQVGGASKGSEELYRIGTQLFTDPMLYREAVVLRGMGGTLEYGSGYFGGLIRLEPVQASDFTGGEPGFRLRQTLQFSTNGDGFTTSTIGAWQVNDDLEVLLNYSWRTEDVTTDGNGTARSAKGYDLPSWLVNTRYTFGDARQHRIGLMMSHTETGEADVPYDSFGTTGGAFGNVDRQTADKTAVLRYDFDAPGNDLLQLRVDLSKSDQKIGQQYVPGSSPLEGTPSFPSLEPLVNADHRYRTTKLLIRNTAFFVTGAARHDLRTGLEITNRQRLDASSAPGGTDRRFALFAVDDIGFTGGLTLTPQLRFERQRVGGAAYGTFHNDAAMGGLAVRYAFGSGFAVLGGAYFNQNLPILDDLTNPAYMTRPEKAVTYEAGLSFDGFDVISGGDALAIKALAYATRIWDITSYSGITDARLNGLEIEAAYSTAGGFYADMNANITRGRNTTPGAASPYWSRSAADQIRLTLGRKWGGGLDLSWEAVADARMTRAAAPTPGLVVHNLRATYRPQNGVLAGAELRLGIENLFDTAYTPHLATRPAAGRNIKLTLAKTF